MPVTRRAFNASSASLLALTVLGCEESAPEPPAPEAGAAPGGGNPNRAKLATEPFLVGPPQQYAAAGLYDGYKDDKGVWLVSDGATLVALSATCTHTGCTTRWLADERQFECPCHRSRFDAAGINLENAKAKRPLERCALRLVADAPGGPQVEVDPTRRFRQERGEWSNPESQLSLA